MSRAHTTLVTGGAGFLGSAFVRTLLARSSGERVIVLDWMRHAGTRANLDGLPADGRCVVVEGDLADAALLDRLFEAHAPDRVVHFAAETHVDRSIHDPGAFVHSNLVGTFTLLEAARRRWAGRQDVRLHHVSTDEVYGSRGPHEAPSGERATFLPSSPYSATKAGSDHLVHAWAHTYGLPVSLTRSCNIYGPRQHPEKLIPLSVLRATAGEEIPIYGDGMQLREWLYVDDLCEAILAVLERGVPGCVYNVSSQRAVPNLELVRRVCAILDEARPEGAPHARLVRHVGDRPGHDRRYAIDAGALWRDLGWAPKVGLHEGLERTVAWYLQNRAWVEGVAGEAFRGWLEKNYAGR